MSEHYNPHVEAAFRLETKRLCDAMNKSLSELAAFVAIEVARIESKFTVQHGDGKESA